MKIESFWNGMPSHPKTIKGSQGSGYSCRHIKRSKYYGKCQKRKSLRQIRRYGFDLSECWGLDYVIRHFMSDNFGGFWRICGDVSNWKQYDLNGNYNPHNDDANKWCKTRYDSFIAHLQDFVDNSSKEDFNKLAEFCIPRLRHLAKIIHGWPSGEDFKTPKDWSNELINMADKFEQGTYSKHFVTHFFDLWD